jgi:hypothetical protein
VDARKGTTATPVQLYCAGLRLFCERFGQGIILKSRSMTWLRRLCD